jgi:LytR cell envelope-related transcriptional attenuator
MPAATKKSRPRIRVEESESPVVETVPEIKEEVIPPPVEETPELPEKLEEVASPIQEAPSEQTSSDTSPSITSFAQLDVPPPVHPAHDNNAEPAETKPESTHIEEFTVAEPEVVETPEVSVAPAEPQPAPHVPSPNSLSSDEVKEWLKDVRPDITKESVKGGSVSVGKILLVAVIVVALGALAGGLYYYQSSTRSDGAIAMSPTPTPQTTETTPTPEVTPEPEEVEEVDLATLKVQILNGSGIAGEAGKASTLLEAEGFKKAATTNAASFDFVDTEVQLKSTVPNSVFEEIKAALEKNYKGVSKVTRAISASESYDIIITIGEKK